MANTYLLEVGVEEMPAHVVTPSIKQLHQRVANYLKEERISFDQIKEFATPRRLALLISGLSDEQPDIDESVKGPAKKIAQDADGNWTKAAIGFTRGQGATVDDIEFKEVKGVEYVFVEKHIAGKPVAKVLQGLPSVITAMTFPTLMKWGYNNLQFIRPIRWLVSLLNDQVVPFKILDVTAGRTTRGHRFLGHNLDLKQASDYEAALKDDFVIADQAQRKQLIVDQIHQIAAAHKWDVDRDDNLLEEVNNLVEWPTAFAGDFDPKYLELPEVVLITSMRDNQRFFCVRGDDGKLLPHFISVRNGNEKHLANVIKGNERVLVPRLEDAKFFYQEDQKITISQYVERLKRVSFHDKIGSMAEKLARVTVLAQLIGKQVGLSDQELTDLKRASQIYKFDLTTQMVGEFAELQGYMGDIYARLQGEDDAVATAIQEQYMPVSAEGALPHTTVGTVLSIADKLDSIMSFFAVNMIPSGSNDPYALRRQAYGIVRIIASRGWQVPLMDMSQQYSDALKQAGVANQLDFAKHARDVREFFLDRLRQLFHGEKLRHDIVDAVTVTRQNDIDAVIEAAKALDERKDKPDFKGAIEALTRVCRLAKKGKLAPDDWHIDPQHFEADSEQQLLTATKELQAKFAQQSLAQHLDGLLALEPVITKYFDDNMIMAKDEAVRHNRLAQLSIIAHMTEEFGNLDKLIVK